MSALTLRIPNDLKNKAKEIAQKQHLSFNAFINHWIEIAVIREETIEWMQKRCAGKQPDQLIRQFGDFLKQTKHGTEPSFEEIQMEIVKDI